MANVIIGMGVMAYRYRYYDTGSFLLYLAILAAFFLCIIASASVNNSFRKYGRTAAGCGLTGAEVAERLLQSQGIFGVGIAHCSGNLTDHYDPRSRVLYLSDPVYDSRSISAICVAAHECGHAMQHERAYAPLRLRSALAPTVTFCSRAYIPVFIVGCLLARFGSFEFIWAGIVLFAVMVLFRLVTLPVEFDASHRALNALQRQYILSDSELKKGKKVLRAAAMTYVTSALLSVLQLLRLIGIGRRRN